MRRSKFCISLIVLGIAAAVYLTAHMTVRYLRMRTNTGKLFSREETLKTGTLDPSPALWMYYNKLKSWRGGIPRTKIIILTYMRSGSTLTGTLFEHHPDVFYLFEPMHSLKWIWWSGHTKLNFLSQNPRQVRNDNDFSKEAIEIARGVLHCQFVDIDIATLTQNHHFSSNDTKPYITCIRSKGGLMHILPCLDIIYQTCSNSHVSVLKTIRFPMKAVETMMSDSSLKVIHLIRDPRPTIRSQIGYGRSRWSNLVKYSKEHCDRVAEDLEVTQRLMMKYPGRVKLLQYEDLTKDPIDHVKDLYSFAGLGYSKETEKYVKSLTESEDERRCPLCVKTKNSTKKSLAWRHELSYTRAQVIDYNCQSVYKKLGYVAVESAKHLTDLTKSLKTKRNM